MGPGVGELSGASCLKTAVVRGEHPLRLLQHVSCDVRENSIACLTLICQSLGQVYQALIQAICRSVNVTMVVVAIYRLLTTWTHCYLQALPVAETSGLF